MRLPVHICVRIFQHWIQHGMADVCRRIIDTDVLPWKFIGRGAIGTLFEGAHFPYILTGSLSAWHGTDMTHADIQAFRDAVNTFIQHPIVVLPLVYTFQGTRHWQRLNSVLDNLWKRGPVVYYTQMHILATVTGQPLYVQEGSPLQLTVDECIFDFDITVVDYKSTILNTTLLYRYPAKISISTAHIADPGVDAECRAVATKRMLTFEDATLLRLILPDLLQPIIATGIKYT